MQSHTRRQPTKLSFAVAPEWRLTSNRLSRSAIRLFPRRAARDGIALAPGKGLPTVYIYNRHTYSPGSLYTRFTSLSLSSTLTRNYPCARLAHEFNCRRNFSRRFPITIAKALWMRASSPSQSFQFQRKLAYICHLRENFEFFFSIHLKKKER